MVRNAQETHSDKARGHFNEKTNFATSSAFTFGESATMVELAEKAKLDYTVTMEPSYTFQHPNGENPEGKFAKTPNQFSLVRSDDHAVISAKTVSKGYGILQPLTVARNLDIFVNAGYATPELGIDWGTPEGSNVLFQLRMNDVGNGPKDDGGWASFFTVHSPYGSGCARGLITRQRAWCANQVAGMFQFGSDWKVRHGKNVEYNVEAAMRDWSAAHEAIRAFDAEYDRLRRVKVDVALVVDQLMGIADKKSEDIPTRTKNKRDDIIARCNRENDGTFGETLADVLNGVTNWTTFDDGGKDGKTGFRRFVSSVDGSRGTFQAAAFKSLVAMIPEGI